MIIGGIDGCRGGWFLIKWDGQEYTHAFHPSLIGLLEATPGLERVFIDMPLGLGSATTSRTIEQKLRKELPGRASTVFNVPVREALWQPDDAAAKKANLRVEGKSLSLQTLNILPKIRELDDLLRNGHYKTEFVESHPELCFKYFNCGEVVHSRKSKSIGIRERMKILQVTDKGVKPLLPPEFKSYRQGDVRQDDILDAICLCLANRLSFNSETSYITQDPSRDDHGIPIRIGYYDPIGTGQKT
jgi:8-oxo-dGTP diphosphatase